MNTLKMLIPKGRINKNVIALLNDAGYGIETVEREYIPRVAAPGLEAKIMKAQNIPKFIELGSHDIGFTGYDWIEETGADVAEVLDVGFDPVRIVAAVPESLREEDLKAKKIIAASEYQEIARRYLEKSGFDYMLIRAYGATEVFPPDDANMIIDNVSTGRTLKKHNLTVVTEIMRSSTRFIANKRALADPWKMRKIGEMKMLFQSVLDARGRVMLEMNIPREKFEEIVGMLPCMRSPTVAPLYGDGGYAVKIAVKKQEIISLLPVLKKMGATDILEYEIRKVIA